MEQLNDTVSALVNDPRMRPLLEKMLAHEDRVLKGGGWHVEGQYDGRPFGWEWYEVQIMPAYLNQLVASGAVSVVGKSNKHTDYRLTDPELVRKGLAGEIGGEAVTTGNGALDAAMVGLFQPVIGYEDVKTVFLAAIESPLPVHILLEGPPACAKTLFLMETGRLPGARYAVGGSSSKAGLTDLLFAYKPRYLLVDELETIDNPGDYSVLLTLMESGLVVETKYHRTHSIRLDTRVFAACNDSSKLAPALLSRFKPTPIRLREYTPDEFRAIVAKILTLREGFSEDFAKAAATATLQLGSRDVRYAVNLARLARGDEAKLVAIADILRKRR